MRDKKRDRHTENALDGPKRHANYGLSLPMSIPTLGESLVQFYVAQIAQIQSIYYLLFGRRLCRSAWRRRAAASSSKVGPVWRTFFIISAGRKSPFFWRNFGFYGLCRFKWPGLYSLDALVASTVNCLDGILRHSASPVRFFSLLMATHRGAETGKTVHLWMNSKRE